MCDAIFDLKMLSNYFGFFFMVLKDKLFFMFSGTSKCAIQLSDIAVQALYKLSLNLIFHSSEEFILKHFLENVSYFFMLNHIIFGTN